MRRPDLVSDCASCAALCCVATSFEACEDFAFAKPAGARCANLDQADRCTIHAELSSRGFSGCSAYECYGAGPRATQAFAAQRGAAGQLTRRDEAFMILRVVYESLWYLTEAAKLLPAHATELARELTEEIARLDAIAASPALLMRDGGDVDVRARSAAARALLARVGSALGGRRALRVLQPTAAVTK